MKKTFIISLSIIASHLFGGMAIAQPRMEFWEEFYRYTPQDPELIGNTVGICRIAPTEDLVNIKKFLDLRPKRCKNFLAGPVDELCHRFRDLQACHKHLPGICEIRAFHRFAGCFPFANPPPEAMYSRDTAYVKYMPLCIDPDNGNEIQVTDYVPLTENQFFGHPEGYNGEDDEEYDQFAQGVREENQTSNVGNKNYAWRSRLKIIGVSLATAVPLAVFHVLTRGAFLKPVQNSVFNPIIAPTTPMQIQGGQAFQLETDGSAIECEVLENDYYACDIGSNGKTLYRSEHGFLIQVF